MCNKIVLLVFLFSSIAAFSQEDSYMNDIAKNGCECASKITKSRNDEAFNMELGLCIIQAAKDYKEEIKRDYKVDLVKKPEGSDKLWEAVGYQMAFICPEVFTEKSENNIKPETTTATVKGTITYIDREGFVTFSVKTEQEKTFKFYWFEAIESNIDITQKYHTLNGSKVNITYYTQNIFDSRINEYRLFNIIKVLNVE